MSFGNTISRLRGPTNNAKNSNTFTFKNQNTPLIRSRFTSPLPAFRNSGIPNGLKTPILSNSTLFGTNKNENHGPAVEMIDCESWGPEEFFETNENAIGSGKDPHEKRKNDFPYPTNVMRREKKLMSDPYGAYQRNQSAQFANEQINTTPLRQTILSTETANGFGYKINEKEKRVTKVIQENTPKICPKWSPTDSMIKPKAGLDKEQNFPRIISVTVEKFLSCPKTFDCGKVIFELFGILERSWDVPQPGAKKIQLKSQKKKSSVTCTYYAIDRPLPKLQLGQWLRCIMLVRSNGDYQCLAIRSASVNELKYLDQLVATSSKSLAMLLKSQTGY